MGFLTVLLLCALSFYVGLLQGRDNTFLKRYIEKFKKNLAKSKNNKSQMKESNEGREKSVKEDSSKKERKVISIKDYKRKE